ncbi:NADH:flavin oxidoreductase [Stutzerimonas urumqiensis]|uniref:oxidoreductase n=1 Tax=Stutzerimonas urumqiensis TaxID=638269 RepID=UPI000EACD67F|nr:NADH:flavin oxidoreductase [Stutzerimonas urumqiensis]
MPRLFEPYSLKSLTLRNRAVLAPMTRVSAEPEGYANDLIRDYYGSFAKGGFGLLITEGLYTDTAFSQGYINQPGIATEQQRDCWVPVVQAVHDAGAGFVAQLMHGGAQTQGNLHHARHVGPSAVQPKGSQLSFYGGEGPYQVPSEMTDGEIAEAIAGFAQAAVHARDAGFDGVELHGANGYLLHEFMSAEFNQRTDRWGGDFKARLALPLAVIRAVRDAVGEDFVVGMRLSQQMVTDSDLKWEGGTEAAKLRMATLANAGLDYLHISEPDIAAPAFGEGPTLCELARAVGPVTLIGNGGIRTGEQAEQLLGQGTMDLVAVGKAALADHDWPRRVEHGEPLTPFDYGMFVPMATVTNELAWRQAHYPTAS